MLIIFYFLLGFYGLVFGLQLWLFRYRNAATLHDLDLNSNLNIQKTKSPPLKITCLICAKNEATTLQEQLPYFLEQIYPNDSWELLVVNDGSSDDTQNLLTHFAQQHPQLRVLNLSPDVPKHFPGKKAALHYGIQQARYPYLLLSDADCRPATKYWLQTMAAAALSQKKEIILGYGAYQEKAGWLNKLIRWETAQTAIHYFSLALHGKAYMGVGRNLFYAKNFYEAALEDPGFQKNYSALASGDDDLLISYFSQHHAIGWCLSPLAHTLSTPKENYRDWLRQKQRHVGTGKYYPPTIKKILGLQALSSALIWLLPLLLVIFYFCRNAQLSSHKFVNWSLILVAGTWFLRLLLYWNNSLQWYRLLNEKKLDSFYPFGEVGHALLHLILTPYIFWKNKQQWN